MSIEAIDRALRAAALREAAALSYATDTTLPSYLSDEEKLIWLNGFIAGRKREQELTQLRDHYRSMNRQSGAFWGQ